MRADKLSDLAARGARECATGVASRACKLLVRLACCVQALSAAFTAALWGLSHNSVPGTPDTDEAYLSSFAYLSIRWIIDREDVPPSPPPPWLRS